MGLVPKSPIHIGLICVKNPKPNISRLGPFKAAVVIIAARAAVDTDSEAFVVTVLHLLLTSAASTVVATASTAPVASAAYVVASAILQYSRCSCTDVATPGKNKAVLGVNYAFCYYG